MKKELVEYICLVCKTKFKEEYKSWKPRTECVKCGKPAQYLSLFNLGGSPNIQRYQDVTALVVDKKTGEPLWLTKKGNKLRYGDSQVRYDLQKDPHGWRATGQKVKERDKYGKRI